MFLKYGLEFVLIDGLQAMVGFLGVFAWCLWGPGFTADAEREVLMNEQCFQVVGQHTCQLRLSIPDPITLCISHRPALSPLHPSPEFEELALT